MGLVVFIFGIESLLCIAAALCALVAAMMRRRDPLRICGVIVVALSALIVSEVIGAAVLDAREPATVTAHVASPRPTASPRAKRVPPATAMRTSTPMKRKKDTEALREFRTQWTDIIRVSASALKAHDTAGEYLRSGNDVDASIELQRCEDTAGGIVSASFKLPLDMKDGSDSELLTAIKKIGEGLVNGCKSARSYLETSVPAHFTDAQAHFNNVVQGIVQSESLARSKYERLGGAPDSLLSFKTALR